MLDEHGKPESITVTPLTRNPNDVTDKRINLDTGNKVVKIKVKAICI
jgi:hypothetical protein